MKAGRRALLCAGPVLLAAALTACASPPSHYYQLAAVPGAARAGGPGKIGVRNISIPGYLDQNNIVKPSGAYQLDSYGNDLWAESLADMLQATMVQDLSQRLPGSTVIGSGGAIGTPSDVLVEINVLRFDPDPSGRIVLTAQVAIEAGGDHTLWLARTLTSSLAPAGPDAAATAAAMSALWAGAADQIAGLIAEGWAGHPRGTDADGT